MLESATWLELGKHFGLWGTVSLVSLYLVYRASRWIGEHVLEPLVGAHTRFLNATTATQERQQKCLEGIREQMGKQTTIMECMKDMFLSSNSQGRRR
jgi:hypothetical protein